MFLTHAVLVSKVVTRVTTGNEITISCGNIPVVLQNVFSSLRRKPKKHQRTCAKHHREPHAITSKEKKKGKRNCIFRLQLPISAFPFLPINQCLGWVCRVTRRCKHNLCSLALLAHVWHGGCCFVVVARFVANKNPLQRQSLSFSGNWPG